MFELKGQQVFVAGHCGMVGEAVARRLKPEGCKILVADHREFDLTQQRANESLLREQKRDVVIVAAAKVGGIGVRKLLFVRSSSIFLEKHLSQ